MSACKFARLPPLTIIPPEFLDKPNKSQNSLFSPYSSCVEMVTSLNLACCY
jgi:hypothetical protein